MIERLADLDLHTAPYSVAEREWGPAFGEERQVRYLIEVAGATQDACTAAITRLLSRLPSIIGPSELVLEPTGGNRPMALTALRTISAAEPYTHAQDIGFRADVEFALAVTPTTHRANRVYLAAPIGDEFPSHADVARSCNGAGEAARYVYADGGRWVVTASASDRGILDLYADVVADEQLVVEFDYDVVAAGATLNVTLELPQTGAGTYTWTLLSKATTGAGRFIAAYRVPAFDAGERAYLRATWSANSASKAYLSGVRIGAKTVANERLLPGAPSDAESTLPYGWSAQAAGNVTYSYGSGKFQLAANVASAAACLAYGTQGVTYATHAAAGTAGMLPVVAGRRIGWRATFAVTARTAGTVAVECAWYTAAGAYLSADTLSSKTGTYSETTLYGEVTPPAGAAYASMLLGVTASANLTATLKDADLGEHIIETPGLIHTTRIGGEVPAALEVWGDVDIESDAWSHAIGVGREDGSPYVFEAEALSWSAGSYSTSTTLYPGTGNTGWYNTGTTEATASIDVSKVRPGAYLLVVRGAAGVTGTATFGCVDTGASVAWGGTTPRWLPTGVVNLPLARTLPGVASLLRVNMWGSGATTQAIADRYLLLPLDQGGSAIVSAYGATVYSAIDVLAGGDVLLDGVANAVLATTAGLRAGPHDRLVVVNEKSSSDETTHLCRFDVYATEAFSLWA